MNILENFRTALKSLWNNRLRSFLTLLGIVIGVYAVVTLLSMAQGIQKQIADQVEGLGPRTILILPGASDNGSFNVAAQLAPSTIRLGDVTLLKEQADLTDPTSIDYAIVLGGILQNGSTRVSALPMGATLGVATNLGYKTINTGREMTSADLVAKAKVMFINQSAADKLGVKVGDNLTLGKNTFTVEGIYANPDTAGLSPADSQNAVLIPATVAQDISGSDLVNRVIVKAKDVNGVDAAKNQITKLLTDKHGATDFTVLLSSDILKSVTKITDLLKYAVVGIAAISLLVGGIGISNIMLVTVAERTREIGIRKAVGATEGAILTQFLIESVLLTIIGALIGIGLAALTSYLAAKFSPLEPAITSSTIMMAVGMGVIAGVIFGLLPAIRAARKNPVQALKYE
ncbi:MAG: ABC transporter permease [Patescibacteria group bacterium]